MRTPLTKILLPNITLQLFAYLNAFGSVQVSASPPIKIDKPFIPKASLNPKVTSPILTRLLSPTIDIDNPLFDKPKSWNKIIEECKKVLKVMKLDIAAFDVKVQTNDKKDPDFIILESNTAPALGEIGIEKYKKELSCLVQKY